MLSLLLAACMLLTGFAVGFSTMAKAATIVDSGKCGANVTYTLDSDGVLTISGTGPMLDYGNDYRTLENRPPWVHLGQYDSPESDVGSIIIQNGVTSIGQEAFYGCSDMISISIPGSVSSIGKYAFMNCSLLRNLVIPNSVSSIGEGAFWNSGIRTVTLPNNPDYTCIREDLFHECENLTSVTIPSNVTEIMEYAFHECKKLKSISLPAGLEKIGEYAFYKCSLLESVNLPDGLTEIGSRAFCGCNTLTSVTIPGSIKTINDFMFSECDKLASVTISRGVWHIGDFAFFCCPAMTTVNLPDTLRTIGKDAFSFVYLSALKEITIPESVNMIYGNPFGTTSIIIYGTAGSYAEEWAAENKCAFVAIETPAAPPVITVQPKNQTAGEGNLATFSVTATGDGLTYAWYYKDPGQSSFTKSASTANSVTYNATAVRNGRQVYCVVTDQNGNSVQTNVVTMTVTPALKITTQPTSRTVNAGTNATFSVTATGSGLTYAWYYKDPGASAFSKSASTASSVTYTTSAARNGRQVYCVVKDKNGNTVKSNTVTLTVTATSGPKITAQPKNVTVNAGTNATFSVTATGTGLTYAWYYKDTGATAFSKSASTTSSVTYTTSAARNGRQVYCVVKDNNGNTAKSNTVTLTVVTGLAITAQPKSVAVSAGTNATFSLTAAGDGLTYSWYYKDPGATKFTKSASTASFVTYTTSAARNGRQIYCVVMDQEGNTVKSNTVTLTVVDGLTITAQPKSVSVKAGTNATFSLTAVGDGLTYSWYYKDPGAAKFSKSASTANFVTYTTSAARNGRQIYCVVMDQEGNTVKSNTVTLTVQ